MVLLPILVLVLALLFGVPIAVALAGSGLLGIYLVTGDFDKGPACAASGRCSP